MRTCSRVAYAAVACALALAGCVEPVQYGGPIPIDHAGLRARLERLCGVTEQTLGCPLLARLASEASSPFPPPPQARDPQVDGGLTTD